MNGDPGPIPNLPDSWRDAEILSNRPVIEETILNWIAVHGAVVLASRHPAMFTGTKIVLREFISTLEAMFESYGLDPPDGGWRAFYPIE
ncbi:hypothetical protein LCGC14_3120200 [marine sediment metagenome]|uniref:Uncharacterized protein n=1 Tax=marine sediment metagenome TaxID=412755 RepID=A0A0F8W2I4_9ZZZZ